MKSAQSALAEDVQLRVFSAGQMILAIFALVLAGLSVYWYWEACRVATERSSRVIANFVQKHIDPKHPDLNAPQLLAVMREALKLDDSVYMIAALDGQGRIVSAVGESAPYVKGFDFFESVLDPTSGTSSATVLVRATSNPFELALRQPILGRLIAIAVCWAFCAYLLNRLLRAALTDTFVASRQLASQCTSHLRINGLHIGTKNLPRLLISARDSLVEAAQRTHAEVSARTSALREAYDISLEAARLNAKHLREVDEAIEEERNRMALEIHDTLNAQTVALRLYASAISTRAISYGDQEIVELAEKISKEMSALFDTARTIVRDLRPELLNSVGLVGALTQLATTLNVGTTECKLNISSDVGQNLSDAQAIALYRVAQEATTNAQKHAGATKIAMNIFAAPPPWHWRLMVSDNGQGFEVSQSNGSTKGLSGMQKRASAVGGVCSIASSPNGTVVTMVV